MEWVMNATTGQFYLREKPGTYCIGVCIVPRAGLDVCGKSLPHRDAINGLCSPQRVARYTY